MSSTARGAQRAEADFYPTPAWPVHRLLERVKLPGGRWIELGAGDGGIIRAVNAKRTDVQWTAVELREECRPALEATGAEVLIVGAQHFASKPDAFDVAILNPPFSEAEAFARIARQCAHETVLLQRLNWLESEKRRAWFAESMPDVYVIGRVDFNGQGGDSIPYAWFVWQSWHSPPRRRGGIELLDRTPARERVAGNVREPGQMALAIPPPQPAPPPKPAEKRISVRRADGSEIAVDEVEG